MYLPTVQSALPVETLELILDYVASNDLAGVILANSVFHKVAARVLYHSITGLPAKRSVVLVGTLAHNDLYASLVRELDLDWSGNTLTGNFLQLLHRAFKQLKYLTWLNLEFYPVDVGNSTWVLEDCTFLLKSFTTSLRCDAVLARFLERQHNLTELCLRTVSPSSGFCLSRQALPRLTHLRTVSSCPRTTAEFIRGRPVEVVSMSLRAGDVASSLDALLLSSRTVKRLTVMSFEIVQPCTLLNEVASRLPNLEALHAVILMMHFTHDMLLETGPCLSQFKSLKYLTVMAPGSPSTLQDEAGIVALWHKACPTLKTVILPRGVIWAYVEKKWVYLQDDVVAGSRDSVTRFASIHGV